MIFLLLCSLVFLVRAGLPATPYLHESHTYSYPVEVEQRPDVHSIESHASLNHSRTFNLFLYDGSIEEIFPYKTKYQCRGWWSKRWLDLSWNSDKIMSLEFKSAVCCASMAQALTTASTENL